MTRRVYTPWGEPDHVEQIAPGITSYITPSHGGLRVSKKLQALMPQCDRAQWFEEDCEWSRVVVAFPQHFSEKQIEHARQTYDAWCKGVVPFSRRQA